MNPIALPLLIAVAAMPASGERSLASMVATERAFAKHASERGVRDAFLTYLAKDGLVFEDGPANAHDVWRARPEPKGKLIWDPEHAMIARSGDLGFTTGLWRAVRPDGTAGGHGNFFTIWRLQAGGEWRAVIDLGNVDPGELPAAKPIRPRDDASTARAASDSDRALAKERLREADAALGKATNLAEAYRAACSADVRCLPPQGRRLDGREPVAEYVGNAYTDQRTEPGSIEVSGAGELGYCVGTLKRTVAATGKAESGHYVRVWRREGGSWRLVFEVTQAKP